MRVTAAGLAPDASNEAVAWASPRSAAWWSGVIPSPCANGAERHTSAIENARTRNGTRLCRMLSTFIL
jgi:hypothetical protein